MQSLILERFIQQGSVFVIESLAIPVSCKKVDYVHEFCSFLLSEKNAVLNSKKFGYNPSNKKSYPSLDKKFFENPNFFPDDEMFQRLHLLRQDFLSSKSVENLWLKVKFA
jgi:spermidine/putrescine-binding protein